MRTKKINLLLIAFALLVMPASAQIYSTAQSVSGIINKYTAVTAVSSCFVSVASTSDLAEGNRVLIIQMKGADISLVNDATFGDISAINSAGNYEFATIKTISGLNVDFEKNLIRTYDPAGVVQLITVPQYNGGVTISGTLTPQSWNGTTGGVVVFEASTLILNADIDATASGFLPGIHHGGANSSGDPTYRSPDNGMYNSGTGSINLTCPRTIWSSDPVRWAAICGNSWRPNVGNPGCGCTVLAPECLNPYVTDPLTYSTSQHFSCIGRLFSATTAVNAEKGESIHVKLSWYNRGRGKIANAGGGGNMHNGGGGGGSNFGSGGIGGRGFSKGGSSTNTVGQDIAQGIGGVALSSYYPSKIFLGGGGGAGQGNDNVAIPGANGGGIVIIKATTLQNPSGYKIMAKGEDNYRPAPNPGGHDGAGGGGGGGVVLLNITTYSNTVTVSAKGGKGADNLFVPSGGGSGNDCYGPGGGGGGGAILFSQGSTPGGVATAVAGGVAGIQPNPSPCAGTFTVSFGATAGSNGSVLYNLTLPEGTVNCSSLPVEMLYFHAYFSDNSVSLNWATASEKNNDRYEILRSTDGFTWQTIGSVDGKGNASHVQAYQYEDKNPPYGIVYYKIRQIDIDGTFKDTPLKKLIRDVFLEEILNVFPNPLGQSLNLNLIVSVLEESDYQIEISDLLGKKQILQSFNLTKGINELSLNLDALSNGCYIVSLIGKEKKHSKIIMVY